MDSEVRQRIFNLLNAIEADFPRRKMAAEALFRKHGIDESYDLEIEPPGPMMPLPTFDSATSRAPSAMLRARFEYAGTVKIGGQIWLDGRGMASAINDAEILVRHQALHEHDERSAPRLFSGDRLGLFAVKQDLPEDVTYLAWPKSDDEPEIWVYADYDSYNFKNLAVYLQWRLSRE